MTFADSMQIGWACSDKSTYNLEHRMEGCDRLGSVRIVTKGEDRGYENKRVQSEFDQGCMADSLL